MELHSPPSSEAGCPVAGTPNPNPHSCTLLPACKPLPPPQSSYARLCRGLDQSKPCPDLLQGPPPKHDEVDSSPEEQFVKHHIMWPDEQGAAAAGTQHGSTAAAAQHPSALQRVRETVVSHLSVQGGVVWDKANKESGPHSSG